MDQRLEVISGKLDILEQQERQLLIDLNVVRIQKSTLYSERMSIQRMDLVPDVLLISFEMLVQDQEEYSMDAALIISHVCRHWRQIAVAHPPLWSKLVVRCGTSHPNLEQVKTFLDRAGDVVSLDLVVAKSPFQPPAQPPAQHNQVVMNFLQETIIKDNLSRCRTVRWSWRFESLMTTLHSSYSFPNLTRLSLGPDETFTSRDSRSSIPDNSPPPSFPSLRSLAIQGILFEHVPLTAYSNLCTLELSFSGKSKCPHSVDLSRFLTVFEETRQLEELSFANFTVCLNLRLGDYDFWEDPWGHWVVESTPPVPLQNLKRLSWCRPPSRYFYIFFLFFPCPQLEILQVAPDDKYKWEDGRTSRNVNLTPETFANLTSSHPLIITFQSLTQIDIGSKITNPLRYILERMDFPLLRRLGVELDPSQKPSLNRFATRDPPDLALPGVESIFRDPRLVGLTHLSLASTSLSAMPRIFKYTPSLEQLALHDCIGSYDAICALAGGSCSCSHSATVDRSVKRLCPSLSTIELSECDDLDFRCLKALVLDRNVDRRNEVVGEISEPVQKRKIKPLGNKFRRVAQSQSSRITQMLPGNDAMVKPARITSLTLLDCPGVSDMQAVDLQELVDTVIWS